jgi:hypothetical protein
MSEAMNIDVHVPVTNRMIAAGVGVLQEYAMPRELAERVARRVFVEMALNAMAAPAPAPAAE